jgi:hypothetical protein
VDGVLPESCPAVPGEHGDGLILNVVHVGTPLRHNPYRRETHRLTD